MLKELARHRKTATHVATKLARHFVADEPSPALVRGWTRSFATPTATSRRSPRNNQNLDAGAEQAQAASGYWPWCARPACAAIPSGSREVRRCSAGRVAAALPKGFADDEGAWIDTMGPRLDMANNFADRVAERIDPKEVVETGLGRSLRPKRKSAVARAESRQQALALAFMSPNFSGVIMALAFAHAAPCWSAPVPCSLGRAHPNWRTQRRHPRVSLSSSVVLSTGLAWLRRLAIRLVHVCAAIVSTAMSHAPLNSFFALNRQCRTFIGCTRRSRQSLCMRRRRPIGESGRISTARTSWRAARPSQAGSTARSRRSRRMDKWIHKAAERSDRDPAARHRPVVISWRPRPLFRQATTPKCACSTFIVTPDAKLARAFEGRRDLLAAWRVPGGIETMPLREGKHSQTLVAFGNTSETLRAPPRNTSHSPTARAWVRRASWAGIPTSTKARAAEQLAALLGALDEAIAAIETMADAWSETVIAVVTEFVVPQHINGTDGTDHGTATVAVLAGGALKGGRVIADWPGLRRPSMKVAISRPRSTCAPC